MACDGQANAITTNKQNISMYHTSKIVSLAACPSTQVINSFVSNSSFSLIQPWFKSQCLILFRCILRQKLHSSLDSRTICIPHVRLKHLDVSISYTAPSVWNSLSCKIRHIHQFNQPLYLKSLCSEDSSV